MRLQYLFACLFLLMGCSAHVEAQALADLPLPNRLGLLNDRAQLSFPAAAKVSTRPTDIMAADANANRETRVVLDEGESRLVFFAQDLYAHGDKALVLSVLTKKDAASKAKTTTLIDDGRLLAVLSTPTAFDPGKAAILVNTLTVKTADNLVFQVGAYINPAAYSSRAEYSKLTERVFRTLVAGSRMVPTTARTETLPIFGTTKKFRFAVPENYGLTVDQKYDFQVFLLRPYALFGSAAASQLIVYVGRHPSLMYKQEDLTREQMQEVPGTFLGQPVKWLTHASEAKHTYLKEQLIAGDAVEPGLILHVGMMADSPAAISELTAAAAAVTLVP